MGLFKPPEPTYEELLEKKKRLKKIVLYWQYPSGHFVPPNKRHRLMADLRELDKFLQSHPDNPDLQEEDEDIPAAMRAPSDSTAD